MASKRQQFGAATRQPARDPPGSALARGDAIPYCEKCVSTGRKAYEPLGRPLRWMSQSITAAEKVEAREIAASVPLADIRSFLICWAMPILASSAVFTFTALPEHYGCPRVEEPLGATRSTRSNAVLRYLYWNNNFHAEHHLFPSIPFHRLADAHRALRDRLQVIQPGYAPWHLAYVKGFLARP